MTNERTYWLLGLPFDAADMNAAVGRIKAAALSHRRLIVVTPNVNFAAMAGRDATFRQTILESQLSLVDGMPLVWLGRAAGIPFTERVAGSSLLMRLAVDPGPSPLRIFFFGGEPGVAELAASRIHELGSGLTVAGFHSPGFGSIDSMSTREIIESINRARPDILVLSFGALKGHRWIARNHQHIDAPVITNLGAAINFIAGSVRRSPAWMQAAGLEWLWRIAQEPKLFSRYWYDGVYLFKEVLRWRRGRKRSTTARLGITRDPQETGHHWQVSGPVTEQSCAELETFLRASRTLAPTDTVVDLAGVTELDAIGLGLLYAFRFRWTPDRMPELICSSPAGKTLLQMHHAECLLSAPAHVNAESRISANG